jgi:hypothetical protein
LDELYTLCGKAEMREPLDFMYLEKNVAKLENLLKHHLIYNIYGNEDKKGIHDTFLLHNSKNKINSIQILLFNTKINLMGQNYTSEKKLCFVSGLSGPKWHCIVEHFTDYMKWWGSIGIYSEQSIESFHQIIMRYEKALTSLSGTDKMTTLVQRVTNGTIFLDEEW